MLFSLSLSLDTVLPWLASLKLEHLVKCPQLALHRHSLHFKQPGQMLSEAVQNGNHGDDIMMM